MNERHPTGRASTESGGGESQETIEQEEWISVLAALDLGETEMAIMFLPTPALEE